MAIPTLGISASPPAATAREERIGGRIGIRRSRSEPLSLCSLKVSHPTAPNRLRTSRSIGTLGFSISSFRSLLLDPEDVAGEVEKSEVGESEASTTDENASKMRVNWVQRICEVRSRWRDRQAKDDGDGDEVAESEEDYQCGVSYESDEESGREEVEWDRETFSRLLNRASWPETKLFSQLAFLCNMAYSIPEIKADELRNYYGLRLVTSSLEKKRAAAIEAKLEEDSTCPPPDWPSPAIGIRSSGRHVRSSSVAHELAATAASYIHSRAKGILFPRAECNADDDGRVANVDVRDEGRMYMPKMATYVAASSVTAVVAAEEEARLEAAKGLQSLHSSPCEWFACDEPCTCTRCFVVQGSDSVASWQANLFFEPTKFEETEALVHRGIYEAAKGIYQQLLPEIAAHLRSHGNRARLRFTGHSLGGSLSLLIALMLLARDAVPRSALLPVVTFGSPAVFCGGHRALEALSVDDTYIHSVMMHRDIVPRAFSCAYPARVALFLKRLNRSFRSHPCLDNDSVLYSPLGKQYILQPDGEVSPPHPLLPPGAALYAVDAGGGRRVLRAFLNTPHPLETLSHPAAYGSEGTISRDHDSKNYLSAVNALLRQRARDLARRSRRQRMIRWLPLVPGPALPMQLNVVEPARKVAAGA